MDPREYCHLAGFLAARQDLASTRSAVSRAYYSLYHVVTDFLVDQGIRLPEKRAEIHETVYRILFNCNDDQLKVIATELNDLRVQRNIADYEMKDDHVLTARTARVLVEKTHRAIERFDNLRQDDVRMSGARLAMTNYARNTLRLG